MTRHPALSALSPASALATPLPRVLRPQRAVPSDAVRPTRAEVNLAHLRHNLRFIQRAAGGAAVWAVLKADGYGHGAKAVARTLERAGANGICVALLEEGIELREAGIQVPILITGGHYGRAWGELLRHELTPVVHDPAQLEALADEVKFAGAEPIDIHVKVDTGMARLGIAPKDVAAMAKALHRIPEVRLQGLMTHFACADSSDPESIDQQLALFEQATSTLRREGIVPSLDMTMLDVTEIGDVRVGDECVILGAQQGSLGKDEITAEEIATTLGTIPWEVLTDISRRVPRFYREP